MALAALLVYSIISCVDNCWFQFAVPFWHSIRTFLVGILHKLGHNLFNKFLHYIWELVQHGGIIACRIVPIHASGSTSLFTQTGLNEVAHSGHNQNMTANAFIVDSPRSVQIEWYQAPHFGFEHEIQLSTSSAPSCCLHDWHFFNGSCRVESFPSVIFDLSKHSCWSMSPSMSFLGPLPHFEQVLRLPDLVIEFQDAETVETGNKNRCATEASHVSWRKLRFRAFPDRVCPWILSLESVDYLLWNKWILR